MAMPSVQNSKVFGVDKVENKLLSNGTPLPPIDDSQVLVDAKSVEKCTSVPVKLDNKSVLPPISGEIYSDAQKPETTSASTLHATEPLPPITSDDEVTASSSTDKLIKEDTSPLPPIEVKPDDVNTTELIESIKVEKSPLPPIAEKNEASPGDGIDATSCNVKEIKTPPTGPDNTDVQFSNVYFVLG